MPVYYISTLFIVTTAGASLVFTTFCFSNWTQPAESLRIPWASFQKLQATLHLQALEGSYK